MEKITDKLLKDIICQDCSINRLGYNGCKNCLRCIEEEKKKLKQKGYEVEEKKSKLDIAYELTDEFTNITIRNKLLTKDMQLLLSRTYDAYDKAIKEIQEQHKKEIGDMNKIHAMSESVLTCFTKQKPQIDNKIIQTIDEIIENCAYTNWVDHMRLLKKQLGIEQ